MDRLTAAYLLCLFESFKGYDFLFQTCGIYTFLSLFILSLSWNLFCKMLHARLQTADLNFSYSFLTCLAASCKAQFIPRFPKFTPQSECNTSVAGIHLFVSSVSNSDIYALNAFRGKNVSLVAGCRDETLSMSMIDKRLLYVRWTSVTNTVVTDVWIRSSTSDLIKTQEEIVAKRKCTTPLTAETSPPQGHSQK